MQPRTVTQRHEEFRIHREMREHANVSLLRDLQKAMAMHKKDIRGHLDPENLQQSYVQHDVLQNQIDDYLQSQFKHIWECLLLFRETPISQLLRKLEIQNSQILKNMQEVQSLREETKDLRENIVQLHVLMSKMTLEGVSFGKALCAPLTNEFDI